jgi:DNA repair protein SbcC/Rad50
MIPLQLQLKNFMSYRAPTTIDFRTVRTACLSGDNGAGKSALLEAMTWALWGKSRAASGRDVVTIGESQMEVTFDFKLADREYRVFRRQTVGARVGTSLEFYVRATSDDEWLTITGDSVRQTEQAIISTIRIDYDTFVNSAFLMQGQADTFTQKRPAERKRILAEILNLGDYDNLSTMAREEERSVRARLGHAAGQIAHLEQQLEKRPEAEAELQRLSEQLVVAGRVVDTLETEARSLQEVLSAMTALLRSRDAAASRLKRTEARLSELQGQEAVDDKAMENLRRLLDRGESIERDYLELLEHRRTMAECTEILRRRQPVEARLREIEREIERMRSGLERQMDQHLQLEKQAQASLVTLIERENELKRLTTEINAEGDISQQLQSTQQELRSAEKEKATLEAECRALKEAMNEIKANMDLLASGQAECPICRRPMKDGEHEHVAELWKAEGKDLGNRFRGHRDRIKALESEIPARSRSVAKLEAAHTRILEKRAVLNRLEREVDGKAKLEGEVRHARTEADRLGVTLAHGTFATELARESANLKQTLESLTFDGLGMEAAEKRMKELSAVEAEHLDLQTARIRYANLEASIETRARSVAELTAELEALRQELDEASHKLQEEPALRERLQSLTDDLERARAERDQGQSAFGAVSNQLEHLDRLATELQTLKDRSTKLGQEADIHRELAIAFGRNGIQAMIVETVLPELEDEANRLLARMATSHLHVRFRSTRQAVSTDNVIETLDIIIRDESGERPYALYSGGEAFRVDFAIRVALSKLLVRRAGTTIDMLIIDEGFGTQDARGRDGLIEALQTVESDFATILVITHIDEVRDMFPTRIEVSKNEAGSFVTVV